MANTGRVLLQGFPRGKEGQVLSIDANGNYVWRWIDGMLSDKGDGGPDEPDISGSEYGDSNVPVLSIVDTADASDSLPLTISRMQRISSNAEFVCIYKDTKLGNRFFLPLVLHRRNKDGHDGHVASWCLVVWGRGRTRMDHSYALGPLISSSWFTYLYSGLGEDLVDNYSPRYTDLNILAYAFENKSYGPTQYKPPEFITPLHPGERYYGPTPQRWVKFLGSPVVVTKYAKSEQPSGMRWRFSDVEGWHNVVDAKVCLVNDTHSFGVYYGQEQVNGITGEKYTKGSIVFNDISGWITPEPVTFIAYRGQLLHVEAPEYLNNSAQCKVNVYTTKEPIPGIRNLSIVQLAAAWRIVTTTGSADSTVDWHLLNNRPGDTVVIPADNKYYKIECNNRLLGYKAPGAMTFKATSGAYIMAEMNYQALPADLIVVYEVDLWGDPPEAARWWWTTVQDPAERPTEHDWYKFGDTVTIPGSKLPIDRFYICFNTVAGYTAPPDVVDDTGIGPNEIVETRPLSPYTPAT